ncbi:uncharacterized protein EHS24_002679 [Apiotrichum porosum]|uniref:Uncharacterized protein n=1 Tax=Apiotrichum porosum TaxID=105984 RepID=A0A427XH84_9TREE|nr:uncharacterized protein EHS24_002679 [Apiotrichum porosum]RSH78218.1 hypothetical protein EHS24_002679 [Apiotrichum porosum]
MTVTSTPTIIPTLSVDVSPGVTAQPSVPTDTDSNHLAALAAGTSRPITPASPDPLLGRGHTYLTVTTHVCDHEHEAATCPTESNIIRSLSHRLQHNRHPSLKTEVRHGHTVVHAVNDALATAFPHINVKLHADLNFGDHHHPSLVEALEVTRDGDAIDCEGEWWWENGRQVVQVIKDVHGVVGVRQV